MRPLSILIVAPALAFGLSGGVAAAVDCYPTCDPTTTTSPTTTRGETTTTVASTTTVADTPTTAETTTTVAPTTTDPGRGAALSGEASTTTTVSPVRASAPSGGRLPLTGGDVLGLIVIGGATTLVGCGLMLIGRRRDTTA